MVQCLAFVIWNRMSFYDKLYLWHIHIVLCIWVRLYCPHHQLRNNKKSVIIVVILLFIPSSIMIVHLFEPWVTWFWRNYIKLQELKIWLDMLEKGYKDIFDQIVSVTNKEKICAIYRLKQLFLKWLRNEHKLFFIHTSECTYCTCMFDHTNMGDMYLYYVAAIWHFIIALEISLTTENLGLDPDMRFVWG